MNGARDFLQKIWEKFEVKQVNLGNRTKLEQAKLEKAKLEPNKNKTRTEHEMN